MGELKDLVRPPFANYDVVVYFGGGLFFLPFVDRYIIQPTDTNFPKFRIELGSTISSETISILCLLFCIYIIGHFLAFLSSHVVEKVIDRYLGKISTAILISAISSEQKRVEAFRSVIWDKIKNIIPEKQLNITIIRSFFHLPVLPYYVVMFLFGIFGYYSTRITSESISLLRYKYAKLVVPDGLLTIRSKWFKPLEYYVINNIPSTFPRMYNYLVIAGLFRTLCIIFLFSTWMTIYYLFHFIAFDKWLLKSMMGLNGYKEGILELVLVSMLYIFCFYSYIKFQRRYAEEAIMALTFSK